MCLWRRIKLGKKRFFLIVLDSVGIGYMPDANAYGPSTKYLLSNNDFSRKTPFVNNNSNEMQEIP